MGAVSKKLASEEEKNVISSALAIGLVATDGIGEWKPKAQAVYLEPARELLETREQLGHVVEP